MLSVSTSVLPGNRGEPRSSSAMMQPTAHMSTASVYRAAPSSNSGARYLRRCQQMSEIVVRIGLCVLRRPQRQLRHAGFESSWQSKAVSWARWQPMAAQLSSCSHLQLLPRDSMLDRHRAQVPNSRHLDWTFKQPICQCVAAYQRVTTRGVYAAFSGLKNLASPMSHSLSTPLYGRDRTCQQRAEPC